MTWNRTWLVAFASGVLLWFLQGQINHYLTPWNLSLFLYGLPVAFAALRLHHHDGWKIVFVLGLWADANTPVRFGLHACTFLIAYSLIYHWRRRVPREETLVGVIFAVTGSTALYLALALALAWRSPSVLSLMPRFGLELVASALAIGLLGPWYFALTENILEFAGVGLRRDQRGIL